MEDTSLDKIPLSLFVFFNIYLSIKSCAERERHVFYCSSFGLNTVGIPGPFHQCGCVLCSDEWGFCVAWFLKAVFMSCRVCLTSEDNDGGGWEWDGVFLVVLYILPPSQNHYPTFSRV